MRQLGRATVAPLKRYVSAYFHAEATAIWLGKCQARRYKKIPMARSLRLPNIDYN
jgi:hypothetical protein